MGATLAASLPAATFPPAMSFPLVCNTYPWITFLQRDGRDFEAELATALGELAASGAESVEPILTSVEVADRYAKLTETAGLKMVSIYVNSVLHEADAMATSIDEVVRIATRAQAQAGTNIVVTNPRPISWGGPENKTDAEILRQADALNQLGAALRREGLTLAYHNHDSELRIGAREFHHMLVATDPANVKFCLDAHWIYRGCDNSTVALFDAVELYGNRIVELHLRQSTAGVWNETFSATGDIDYRRLMTWLGDRDLHPLLTLEQAVESGSPHTMDALTAHRASVAAARDLI